MAAVATGTSTHVVRLIQDEAGFDALAEPWQTLAAEAKCTPFLNFDWLRSSWRHFQSSGSSLFILTVHDAEQRLLGVAPWYRRRTPWSGDVVRFIGSDQACSDYLSLLSAPQREADVVQSIAHWLCSAGAGRWDLIELDGVDANDLTVGLLLDRMGEMNHTVHTREGQSCWRLALPDDWDSYLSTLSRNRRQKIRSLLRKNFDSGTATIHRAMTSESLQRGWEILVDLHERRRTSIGDGGCFSRPGFGDFLREAAEQLHEHDMLRLQWIELDGTPAAVDFSVNDENCIYGYQCGINPDFAKRRPGTLMMAALFRRAIEDGYREFDFLRGSEDYKSHWSAERRPSMRIRIVPPRTITRTRHGIWLGGTTLKQWMKQGRHRMRQLRNGDA